MGELSVLIYILLWIVIPRNTDPDADATFEMNDIGSRFNLMGKEISEITRNPSSELIIFTGVGLIAWGAYYIVRRALPYLDIMAYSDYMWPALLIIAGGFVIYRATRKD